MTTNKNKRRTLGMHNAHPKAVNAPQRSRQRLAQSTQYGSNYGGADDASTQFRNQCEGEVLYEYWSSSSSGGFYKPCNGYHEFGSSRILSTLDGNVARLQHYLGIG